MLDTLTSLSPIIAGLVAGVALRRLGAAQSSDGDFLFRIVFWIGVPCLTFLALATVEITLGLLVFPFACLVATVLALGAGAMLGRAQRLDSQRFATFLLVTTITNSLFALVFAQALFGQEGVARVAAYDAMNAPLVYGAIYALAARANPSHVGRVVLIGKLLRSPPLYAVGLGLAVNLANFPLPGGVQSVVSSLGAPTGFLVTLAIGIMFSPKRSDLRLISVALLVKFVAGLSVAGAVIGIFGLQGTDAIVMLLIGVAPCGFNAVTFASLEKLDARFAASALSVSIPVAVLLSTIVSLAMT